MYDFSPKATKKDESLNSYVRGGKFIGRGGAPAEPLCKRPNHSQAPLGVVDYAAWLL